MRNLSLRIDERETDRRRETEATRKRLLWRRQRNTELCKVVARGGKGKELKDVMKIRRSRKGVYDMRMRRSTRKTDALILDLVTLTPAGVPLPAYYARLRTHRRGRRAQRAAQHALRSYSPRGALTRVIAHAYVRAAARCTSDVARHDRTTSLTPRMRICSRDEYLPGIAGAKLMKIGICLCVHKSKRDPRESHMSP